MILRKLSIVLGILIIVGAFFLKNRLSDQKKPPPRKERIVPAKQVSSKKVNNESIGTSIPIYGRLTAYETLDIVSEVNGRLLSDVKPIKEGKYYKKGDRLLQIDDREARANILAQKSGLMNQISQILVDLKLDYPESFQQWKEYVDAFDINKRLKKLPTPLSDRERYFIAGKNFSTTFYNIESQEIRLNKYTLRAPFSGTITSGNLNPGAFIVSGQKLGTLVNTYAYELEATVNMRELGAIKSGDVVLLESEDIEGTWEGKVKRVSESIDPSTQAVKVFINVKGKGLKGGMYLRGKIDVGSIQAAIEIPRKLLVNDSTIYVVKDSILSLKIIEVTKMTESTAIIKGLEDGEEILNETIVGAFDGMKVKKIDK
mgnify:CR=1 FL=1